MSPRRLEEIEAAIDAARVRHGREIDALLEERAAAQRSAPAIPWTSDRLPPGVSRRAFAEALLPLYRAGDPRVQKIGKTYVADPSVFVGPTRVDDEGPEPARTPANDTASTSGWNPNAAKLEAGLRPRRGQR